MGTLTLNPEEMILELRYSGGRADQGRIPIAVRIRALEALQRAQRLMVEHNLGIDHRPGPPKAAVSEAAKLETLPSVPGSLIERIAPAASVGMDGILAFEQVADGLTGVSAPPEPVSECLQDLLEHLNEKDELTVAKKWDDAAPTPTYRRGDRLSILRRADAQPSRALEPTYIGRLTAVDLFNGHGTLRRAGSRPVRFIFGDDLNAKAATMVWRWIRITCAEDPSSTGHPVATVLDELAELDDSEFWYPPSIEERIESSGIQPYQPAGRNRFLSDRDLDELLPEGPLL